MRANINVIIVGCLIVLTALLIHGCEKKHNLDVLCGKWQSIGRKPDVMIFKEAKQYKVTIFKRDKISRKVKPVTYLIVEEHGNLFINTGFRIDLSYNETLDILTFSPNGDYTRVKTAKTKTDEN